MEYRSLGRTGVQVSVLCLGCMMFGGRTSPEDSYAIIDRGLDAGLNFLDTANVYSRGRSEEVTGEALKRNGKRAAVVLASGVSGWTPLLAAVPFAGFLVRALWAVRQPRPVPDIKRFGFTEVAVELLGGALIATGYLF